MKKKILILFFAVLSTGLFQAKKANAVVAVTGGWPYGWVRGQAFYDYSYRSNTSTLSYKWKCKKSDGDFCLIPGTTKTSPF